MHPCTLATEINCALQRLQQPQGPYVHPRAISFKDGQGKAFWDNLPDRADRDLVGNFTRISHQDRQCWIGFFSVPERNWVGSGNEWDKLVWHCFAAMVVLDETFIYDNDTKYGTTTDLRVKTMLWGLQKSLIEVSMEGVRKSHLQRRPSVPWESGEHRWPGVPQSSSGIRGTAHCDFAQAPHI